MGFKGSERAREYYRTYAREKYKLPEWQAYIAQWKAANPERLEAYWKRSNKKRYAALTPEQKVEKKRAERERRIAVHREAIAHYGGACYCCGETAPLFLSLDHINGGGVVHRKTLGYVRIEVWAKRNDYPDILRVACHNCNFGSYIGAGLCWHQHILQGTTHLLSWPPRYVPGREDPAAYERWRRGDKQRKAIVWYGGQCFCCREDDVAFLTLDHINGGGCRHLRARNGLRLGDWARRNGYPETLRVACWNCNRGRYLNDGECPHHEVA
jgi:hypothetical protein